MVWLCSIPTSLDAGFCRPIHPDRAIVFAVACLDDKRDQLKSFAFLARIITEIVEQIKATFKVLGVATKLRVLCI